MQGIFGLLSIHPVCIHSGWKHILIIWYMFCDMLGYRGGLFPVVWCDFVHLVSVAFCLFCVSSTICDVLCCIVAMVTVRRHGPRKSLVSHLGSSLSVIPICQVVISCADHLLHSRRTLSAHFVISSCHYLRPHAHECTLALLQEIVGTWACDVFDCMLLCELVMRVGTLGLCWRLRKPYRNQDVISLISVCMNLVLLQLWYVERYYSTYTMNACLSLYIPRHYSQQNIQIFVCG